MFKLKKKKVMTLQEHTYMLPDKKRKYEELGCSLLYNLPCLQSHSVSSKQSTLGPTLRSIASQQHLHLAVFPPSPAVWSSDERVPRKAEISDLFHGRPVISSMTIVFL